MKNILFASIIIGLLALPIAGFCEELIKKAPDSKIFGKGGVLDIITNTLFYFLLFAAVIAFFYAGFLFITSQGDPEKFKTAQKAVLYGVIGLLVAFSARGIVKLIETIFKQQ